MPVLHMGFRDKGMVAHIAPFLTIRLLPYCFREKKKGSAISG